MLQIRALRVQLSLITKTFAKLAICIYTNSSDPEPREMIENSLKIKKHKNIVLISCIFEITVNIKLSPVQQIVVEPRSTLQVHEVQCSYYLTDTSIHAEWSCSLLA